MARPTREPNRAAVEAELARGIADGNALRLVFEFARGRGVQPSEWWHIPSCRDFAIGLAFARIVERVSDDGTDRRVAERYACTVLGLNLRTVQTAIRRDRERAATGDILSPKAARKTGIAPPQSLNFRQNTHRMNADDGNRTTARSARTAPTGRTAPRP